MTTTSPAAIVPSSTASIAARSPSKTRAVPSKTSESKPADFTTAPSGASEPLRMVMPPVRWIGVDIARTTLPSTSGGRDVGEVLGHRLPGDGEAVAVQQTGIQQRAHDDGHAADPVDVGHHVATRTA